MKKIENKWKRWERCQKSSLYRILKAEEELPPTREAWDKFWDEEFERVRKCVGDEFWNSLKNVPKDYVDGTT